MLYVNGFVLISSTKEWKAFFKFRISFRISYWPKTKKYSTNNKVGFMQARWEGGICADQHAV